MTQKELIEFCKENDPNYNKDASFKVLEPMWSIPKGIGGIGITESEFKNGFYVQIDTKGRKGFENLEGRVFYFREKIEPTKYLAKLYHSTYRKYYVPLDSLENWGKEIMSHIYDKCVTESDPLVDLCLTGSRETTGKGIIDQIESFKKYEPMTPEELETQKTLYDSVQSLEAMKPVEEFPIKRVYGQINYTKRDSGVNIGNNYDGNVDVYFIVNSNIGVEEKTTMTTQEFSDLVDLMIEARKDLLK